MRRGFRARALASALSLAALFGLLVPAAASALSFRVDNESARSAEEVWITITGANFNVPGMEDDVPRKLSEVPDPLTIDTLDSGRVYVSYGAPVTEGEPFTSQTRGPGRSRRGFGSGLACGGGRCGSVASTAPRPAARSAPRPTAATCSWRPRR
ncbi:MAG TPA: hypothetical protein VF731_02475 [Solirubrobacterales bacterium]